MNLGQGFLILIFIYKELGSDWLVGWLLSNKIMVRDITSLHLLCFSPLLSD